MWYLAWIIPLGIVGLLVTIFLILLIIGWVPPSHWAEGPVRYHPMEPPFGPNSSEKRHL